MMLTFNLCEYSSMRRVTSCRCRVGSLGEKHTSSRMPRSLPRTERCRRRQTRFFRKGMEPSLFEFEGTVRTVLQYNAQTFVDLDMVTYFSEIR